MKPAPILPALLLSCFSLAAIADEPVVETVATGYKFTEGPALAPDGSIYFSDIPSNHILRFDPATGETSVFAEDTGGANGLMFDDAGKLYACAGRRQNVEVYDAATGERVVAAGGTTYGPNDLVIAQHGVYFTDPSYSKPTNEPIIEAVYFFTHGSDAKPIIQGLSKPNGIGLSPDGKTLYVAENGGKKLHAYPILEPGVVGEGRVLFDTAELGGPDGMTVDAQGRIYQSIYDRGILILSPEGKKLGWIESGKQTTNCCFGADGKTLYITADKSLKRVVLNPGE